MLPEFYPETHRRLERTIIDGHSMLYRWKGSGAGGGEARPLVLMAHYDVVPANDEGWERPAFSGDIHDGKVWGRGSIDTKCTLVCAFEAVESLLSQGFAPRCDVYLSFGHDEEVGGNGAPSIVSHLEASGVSPGLVLDEGGAVVRGVFPGVSKPLAMVGVAEKGVADLELLVRSPGGHSSTPTRRGASWRLARAIIRLESRPFPARFPQATRVMFSHLAPHASFGLRLVLANLWLFEPLLLFAFGRLGGELNAICRTTTAVTMLEGSKAMNILPTEARAVVNVRLATGQTQAGAFDRIRKVLHDDLVEMRTLLPGEPSPVSGLSGPSIDVLSATILEVFPQAIVAPYVVLGGTDARHFSRISPTVYRFSPFELSKAERASMHAVNEAIPVASLAKGVEFYQRLIRRMG
jgi:carboxypeptidase PM20D1